jgi:hypothetical protein
LCECRRSTIPKIENTSATLFHGLLVTEIAGYFGEYQGVRIGNPRMQIDWAVAANAGGPKIVDLPAKGTSMRLRHSEEFTAYLIMNHQSNGHELVEVMRERIAQTD